MARQCYKLNLNGEEYKLRLTMAGQKTLLERFPGENIIGIIMGAPDDLERMSALLTEALNWEGNSNKIHTGEELYDELVDAGYAGSADFMKVCLNIAKNAGLLTQDDRDRLEHITGKMIRQEMDMLLNQLEDGELPEAVQEGKENPLAEQRPKALDLKTL